MSRLSDLIHTVKQLDPQLGSDLEREVTPLQERLPFGLNFEKHQPEAVELPGVSVRVGSKVRVLPQRGSGALADRRLWVVQDIQRDASGARQATLALSRSQEIETTEVAVDELVLVAEFRDSIYPGLRSTGAVERGGDKPFHTVINGENFHVLEALTYTHRGNVDAIYIDPPYNTGARDWKYNNDYVEEEDLYRHSKWLAFMERRLRLAGQLLNPDGSVLIVTIDEKEYLRLGLLLEQIFPDRKIQMISSVINPRGIVRGNEFSRTNEFVFFAWNGNAAVLPEGLEETAGTPVAWETMRRRSIAGARGRKGPGACGPNQFFPIYVHDETGQIIGRGNPLPLYAAVSDQRAPEGCTAVFPTREDGTEMNWSLTDTTFDSRWQAGYVRAGKYTPDKPQKYLIQYVLGGVIEDIAAGRARVTGKRPDGSVIAEYVEQKSRMPLSQWDIASHNAQQNGTGLLRQLMPDRVFPYAKSLYAVEDALRHFIGGNRNAVVVDFFAGSGTTAHAVMRLNEADRGHRQSILVTNNEVSVNEQERLREQGLRPGDMGWEQHGICEQITKPRIEAAITGRTPEGQPIAGSYRYNRLSPIADGFAENAEFFTLTYESVWQVSQNRAFGAVAPLLWLRAGGRGRRIDSIADGWGVAEAYGVLEDLDQAGAFIEAVRGQPGFVVAYIITDDERRYQMVCDGLAGIDTVRLYSSYLQNFQINNGTVS
ncbi:site-specific DNA-methyltransferase [Clavibacter michiganensis]|nr:site-specific DNA-methyltransferase [Clavibacter michiganensis]